MQSRSCEHTHLGVKEYGICGLVGKDRGMGPMLSIGRERKQIIGGLPATERMEKRKIDCDPPFVLEYLMCTCTRTGILEQMC